MVESCVRAFYGLGAELLSPRGGTRLGGNGSAPARARAASSGRCDRRGTALPALVTCATVRDVRSDHAVNMVKVMELVTSDGAGGGGGGGRAVGDEEKNGKCGGLCGPRFKKKCRPCRTEVVAALVVWCLMFLGLLSTAAATTMGEDCDWFGSGLSGPERGVSPVYLRCSQGRVRWSYPRGALRVLLRAGGAGKEFRGCVRLGPHAQGARVFLEGPRSLAPLFRDDDGAVRQLARCFRSRGGQAALYVESVPAPPGDFSKRVLDFTYDLEPLPRHGRAYDPAEQCRPCTREEMSRAFCTSDLVARGIIRGVQNKPELEVTELSVKVTKQLRRLTDAPCGENELSSECGGGDGEREGGGDGERGEGGSGAGGPTLIGVQVPLHCGARHGEGEFVFMARRKLGELALTCAPRLQDWVAAVHALEAVGDAHCVLSS